MPKSSITIDEYIAAFPPEVRDILIHIRETILLAAPEAIETISYQMPTYKLKHNLVHFAAYKNHIGFYPTPSAVEAFKNELTPFKVSKGAIQFQFTEPIPYDLISRITRFRVDEETRATQTK